MISTKLIRSDSQSQARTLLGAQAIFHAVAEMKDNARAEARSKAAHYLKRARIRLRRWRASQIQSLSTQFELALAQEADSLYGKTLMQANQDVLELALKVAAEFVRQKLVNDADYLVTRVSELMQQQLSGELKVSINPEQSQAFLRACQESGQTWKVSSDDQVAVGEALISTRGGVLRINWHDHFHELSEQYRDQLREILNERFKC